MTAILDKIRMLEASRDSGALTEEEFARAKARLLDEVEDAVEDAFDDDAYDTPEDVTFFANWEDFEPDTDDAPPRDPAPGVMPRTPPPDTAEGTRIRPTFVEPPARSVWHVVMLCTGLLSLIGLTVFIVVGDFMLAVTVVLTLVAAISVRVVQIMDD